MLIDALNLHPLIFLYEPADIVPAGQEAPNLSLAVVAARVLNSLLPSSQSPSLLPPLHPFLTFTVSETTVLDRTSSTVTHLSLESEVRKFYLSASLLPLYGLTTTEGKAKKPIWLGDKVVKDGIKGANYDRSWCSKAHESCTALAEGVRRFAVEGEKDRVEIGQSLSLVLLRLMVCRHAAAKRFCARCAGSARREQGIDLEHVALLVPRRRVDESSWQ